jgi:hypothetical protein
VGQVRRISRSLLPKSNDNDASFLAQCDKAGQLGHRNAAREWTHRWFALRADELAWFDSRAGGARGKTTVRGATIGCDDFGTHQAFTISVAVDGTTLLLAAPSLREKGAWQHALRRAAALHGSVELS